MNMMPDMVPPGSGRPKAMWRASTGCQRCQTPETPAPGAGPGAETLTAGDYYA
jgi:hypothetical protein